MYFPPSRGFFLSLLLGRTLKSLENALTSLSSPHHCPVSTPCLTHSSGLLYNRLIHQHHQRRTTATLRSFTKTQNFAFLVVSAAVAATFGAALWLRPQRPTNAEYMRKVKRIIEPSLDKAFQEYLGCQKIIFRPCGVIHFPAAPNDDVPKFTQFRMGLFLDTDAANFKGSVIGFGLTLIGIEEKESFDPL